MKIFCKECGIEISDELEKIKDESLLTIKVGEALVPQGYFLASKRNYPHFINSTNKILINESDLKNSADHSEINRLNGCCGPDGMDGFNKICMNGHEIGTIKGDCWIIHCIVIEPSLVTTDPPL